MTDVQKVFQKAFGYNPTVMVQAPGRLELIGNHTDYNQGLVMSLAVDRFMFMAASPRKDGRIEIVSSAYPEPEKFSSHEPVKNPAASWADYVKGVLVELRKRQVYFGGFDAALHSTIPLGAGLSSSAAMEVATALVMRLLFPFSLPPHRSGRSLRLADRAALPPLPPAEKLELAKVCQAAEWSFVGVKCGLLDPISSLFGKAFHAIEIDCQSLTVEHVPMIGEIAIVVCDSGIKHALVGGEYNALRAECEAAAKALGVKSLRAADLPFLAANRSRLTDRQYECAYHVAGEIQRVIFGARALRDGDFAQFGHYMYQSHESSRDCFKNSCPELDLLVELAREHPGCLGARLTGGGFGGATINLVHRDQVTNFINAMRSGYQQRIGRPVDPMICQVVDGAH